MEPQRCYRVKDEGGSPRRWWEVEGFQGEGSLKVGVETSLALEGKGGGAFRWKGRHGQRPGGGRQHVPFGIL